MSMILLLAVQAAGQPVTTYYPVPQAPQQQQAPAASKEQAQAQGYAEAQRALSGQPVTAVPPEQVQVLSVAPGQPVEATAAQASTPAVAASVPAGGLSSNFDGLRVQVVPDAGTNVRYYKGVATVDRQDNSAAVQVTPMGMDHGRLTFAVSILNLGAAADNFGIENVTATVGGQALPVLSRERLDQMAKNRAGWAQFGMAMLGGLAAASAASTRDVYHATTVTPRGLYSTTITAPSIGGQIAAANASASTGYAIAGIQARLDATREALANEILQTTTVMPQDAYAARIVIEKFKGHWPQRVHLTMAFAGKQYPFDFDVSKGR
jgi:hypothetical protein